MRIELDTDTDRQTGRQAGRQAGRQTDRRSELLLLTKNGSINNAFDRSLSQHLID